MIPVFRNSCLVFGSSCLFVILVRTLCAILSPFVNAFAQLCLLGDLDWALFVFITLRALVRSLTPLRAEGN